jgi:hypothetical protein
LLHADFSKIVLKYSNEAHLLRYLTPLRKTNLGNVRREKVGSVPTFLLFMRTNSCPMLVVLSSVTTQYFIAYNGFTTPIDYWLQRAQRVKMGIRHVTAQVLERIHVL